jgi:chromosome segregation ATPase
VLDRVKNRADAALSWRIEQGLEELRGEVDGRLRALEDRLNGLEPRLVEAEQVLRRMAPQIAAIESRLESRRESGEPVGAEAAELDEARSLLEAVRTEHERIRTRVALASQYEERLRVLENRSGEGG